MRIKASFLLELFLLLGLTFEPKSYIRQQLQKFMLSKNESNRQYCLGVKLFACGNIWCTGTDPLQPDGGDGREEG